MTKKVKHAKQKKCILRLINLAFLLSLMSIVMSTSNELQSYLPSEEMLRTASSMKATINSTLVRNVNIPSAARNSVYSSKVVANAAVVDDNSPPVNKPKPPMVEERLWEITKAARKSVSSSKVVANAPVVVDNPPPVTKPKPPSMTQARLWEITKPFANVTTIGYKWQTFYSGYRNQMQSFSAFVVLGGLANHSQILMPTLGYKDTLGSNKYMPFEFLFDVEHWNSFYPELPRMVHCDQELFPNYDCEKRIFQLTDKPTLLHVENRRNHQLGGVLKRYSLKQMGPMMAGGFRNPMELLMIQGALRPHPDLLVIANRLVGDLGGNGTVPYMTLHARVEPDMMKHPVCRDTKVTNLTDIFQFLETTFPDPPATRIFMPINRQSMETGGKINRVNPNATNWMAVHNLKELNRAVEDGLWGGRAKVFAFGSNALMGTKYESRPSTTGAMLDFWIAQNSNVFVGTRVSTFSMDLLHARFYNGNRENYQYLPSGLERWTTNSAKHPPGFAC
jgi:hypothetical protein